MALKEHAALLAEYEPPPAPAAPVLSASARAARLSTLGPAAYLCGAASVLGEMDVETWKIVLDDFLRELGLSAAAGPVARLLAQQVLLAHHAIGRLHLRSAGRTSPAEVAAYHGAVCRLMAECRRSSVALRALVAGTARRGAAAPRAKAGTPEGVRHVRRTKKARRSELGSNDNRTRGRRHARKKVTA
jgi:hypothetical protein